MRLRLPRLILATLLATAGLASSVPTPGRADSTPLIRIGYFPNITHAQAVLGFGDHSFTKGLAGVNLQPKVFNAGPDELNALFAGALDIAYIGPGPAINGYVRSHGAIHIIAGSATGGAVLVARHGAGISSLKDLAGKRVAIPQLGNTQDIVLRALLAGAGLKPSENGGNVRIIAVANPDTLTLFQKGDLDAALVPEPWGSRLVASTGATVVLDSRQIYGGTTPATVVIASTSFLKAHPDLVVRFLRVHDALTRLLQTSGQARFGVETTLNFQIKALTGKPLSAEVLRSSLNRTTFSTAINQAGLSQFAGLSVIAGYLAKGASIAGLVDAGPLSQVAAGN